MGIKQGSAFRILHGGILSGNKRHLVTGNQPVCSGIIGILRRHAGIILLAGIFFSGWTINDAHATHVVGGGMTYRCLGGNNYEITLRIFRDCYYGDQDAFFDSTASIGVFNSSNQLVQELLIPYNPELNDTLTLPFADSCLFIASDICVHTTYYRDTINLSYQAGGYTLAYQRCCRNGSLYNILNPLETGATFFTHLTGTAMQTCNNTPVFDESTQYYLCVNEPFSIDHSAIDSDGDSLVYRFSTPYAGGTLLEGMPQPPAPPPYNPVSWVDPPYNLNNMLGFGQAPLTINAQTGVISGNPGLIGQYVVGIAVDEYRNGVLISTTRRDFQYHVGLCAEVQAKIQAPAAQCDNLLVAFTNKSQLATNYLWNFNDPGNPAGTSTAKNPTFIFSDTGLYTVQLIAQPGSACADTTFHDIFLQNNSLTAAFEVEVLECLDSVRIVGLDQSIDPVSPISDWHWELSYGTTKLISSDPDAYFIIPDTGLQITLSLAVTSENGCMDSHFYTFQLNPLPPALLSDTLVICAGETVDLNPSFVEGYEYQWSPGHLLSDSTAPNPEASPDSTRLFTALITDTSGFCQIEKTVLVEVRNPFLDFDYTYSCDGFTLTLENNSLDLDAFSWDFGVPDTSTDTSFSNDPVFTFPEAGTYTIQLRSISDMPCQVADTLEKTISISGSVVTASFTPSYTACEIDSLTISLSDQSTTFQSTLETWSWIIDDSLWHSGNQPPVLGFSKSDSLVLTLAVETMEGCTDSQTISIPVQLVTGGNFQDTVVSCPFDSVPLYPGANPNLLYHWQPSAGLNDPFAPNPLAHPAEPTTYIVTITAPGVDTCVLERSVTVLTPLPLHPFAGKDSVTCLKEVSLVASVTGSATYQWFSEAGALLGTSSMVTVAPKGQQTYILEATDSLGCQERDTVQLTGHAVDLSYQPSQLFCPGTSDNLVVINTDTADLVTFNWTPSSLILAGQTTGTPVIATLVPFQQLFSFEATNQFGCIDTGSIQFTVLEVDTLTHLLTGEQCEGLTVHFEHSGPNAPFYEWYFEGLDQPPYATGSQVSYEFPDTGLYEIMLVLPVAGCADTLTYSFGVKNGPFMKADFGIDITACEPGQATLQLTDSSYHVQSPLVSWLWTLNDSLLSTNQQTGFELFNDQVITLKLAVTSAGGCRDSITKVIPINIIANHDLEDSLKICPGESIHLFPGADTAYQYQWSPTMSLDNSNAPNPLATPLETTAYQVTVTATGPYTTCTLQDSLVLEVLPALQLLSPADTNTCLPQLALSASTLLPAQITWTNIAGSDTITGPDILVTTNGNQAYLLKAIDSNGCAEQDTVNITGNPAMVNLSATDLLVCQNEQLAISFQSAYTNDFWMLTSTPSQVFVLASPSGPLTANTSNPGTFEETVQFTNQYGCSQIIPMTLTVLPDDIELGFSWIPSCDGFTVNFENTTLNGSDTFYIWNFGNPADPAGFSFNPNPAYTFPDTGIYAVTLTLTAPLACVDTLTQLVHIQEDVLDADFEVIFETCYADSVSLVLKDRTRNDQTDETTLAWYLEGQYYAGEEEVSLTIFGDSTFDVQLIASTSAGCIDSVSRPVEVAPLADLFLADTLIRCIGQGVNLNPDADSSLEYSWSPALGLDDPTSPNPFATPQASTLYAVAIYNISSDTCSIFKELLVTVPPAINLAVPDDFDTCENLVTLTASATTPVTWEWLDENGTLLSSNANAVYAPSGVEVLTVQATDINGCTEQDSIQVGGFGLDIQLPSDTFFCVGTPATLSVVNLDPVDQLSYFWQPGSFIAGSVTSQTIALENHSFFDTLITLYISNQFGCSRTDSIRVVLLDTTPPAAAITYGQCAGLTVDFLYDSPNAAYYEWDFGDPQNPGSGATGSNVSYTYASTGEYTVSLIPLEGSINCLPPYTFQVEVVDGPFFTTQADWSYLECGESAVIQFTDQSAHLQDVITGWSWTFSNGVLDSVASPLLTLTEDQLLEYLLVVRTSTGCTDSVTGSIPVHLIQVALPVPMLICRGDSVFLNPNTANPAYSYSWAPSTGLSDSTAPNPIARPLETTTYSVTVTDSSSGDTCTVVRSVTVELFPVLELNTTGDVVLCADVPATLSASTNLPSNLQWSDDGDFSNILSTASSLTVNPGRPALFYIRATDGNNCMATDTLAVGNYLPSIDLADALEVCWNEETQLIASNNYPDDTLSYYWTPEFYFSSGFQTPSPTITLEDSVTLYVEVSNQYGCVLLDSVQVAVVNLEDELFVFASPDTISYGSSSQLFATFNPTYTYNWTPADDLSNPTFHQPIASPLETTLYQLEVSSPNGCIRTDSLLITVVERACGEPYIFVPLAFSPNNDGENDVLYVRGNQIDKMVFSVFNRWGEEVFRSTNPANGWNGRYNGKELPPDVFGYYLEVTCLNGDTFFKKGNVTLLR